MLTRGGGGLADSWRGWMLQGKVVFVEKVSEKMVTSSRGKRII